MPGISPGKRPPAPDLSSTCTEQWFLAHGTEQDEFLTQRVNNRRFRVGTSDLGGGHLSRIWFLESQPYCHRHLSPNRRAKRQLSSRVASGAIKPNRIPGAGSREPKPLRFRELGVMHPS